jgi:KDO2-lipid IV(A) lauroyltransferase
VLTAHYGHWELLGAALAAAGVEVHSVAAREGRGPLHRWLATHRAALGLTVHPPGGGARTAVRRLEDGHPVAIFFDLETRERARTLDFLGRPTRFSRTAERLLGISGASALRLWSVSTGGGRYRLVWADLGGEDPLAEAVAALEAAVRADPVQWVWLVDRWPPSTG